MMTSEKYKRLCNLIEVTGLELSELLKLIKIPAERNSLADNLDYIIEAGHMAASLKNLSSIKDKFDAEEAVAGERFTDFYAG